MKPLEWEEGALSAKKEAQCDKATVVVVFLIELYQDTAASDASGIANPLLPAFCHCKLT